MLPQFLTLLFTGLRVSQGDTAGGGSLPKPSLTAWPSSAVPQGSPVRLTCRAPITDLGKTFLIRGGLTVEDMSSSETTGGLAYFNFTGIQSSQAGWYTCEYQRKNKPRDTSPRSEALLLLVTGYFPKPRLQAPPRGEVPAGGNVTLQCHWPQHMTEATHFAILRAGVSSTPTQVWVSQRRGASFSLLNVTASDSGNYSCVYHQTQAPFLASHPSDPISIQVTDKEQQGTSKGLGKSTDVLQTRRRSGLGRAFLPKQQEPRGLTCVSTCSDPAGSSSKEQGATEVTLIAVFTSLLLLLTAVLIYKHARCGAAPGKVTASPHSWKEPEEAETNASVPRLSCSPAADEGTWMSRAEEPYGVTYVELNTRSLQEHPSNQMNQSLETCVYSVLKA
ncbi:PREDICTED: T-cell-interacting, activating receptor on myeloid cells protein 1 isoform X2 [Condylura cristata]|uniref:T-cell-interacting, activating receptor on myeloid cells protein 1 isoform X2 n=1 Tax=Condylura cristata TaxID=143302 RepID=UPI00064397DF|nr:PREDICTED: T-cell-interacting, activating receptor on myeloid cells protein 1 isoform X2 [Condylura cristata]